MVDRMENKKSVYSKMLKFVVCMSFFFNQIYECFLWGKLLFCVYEITTDDTQIDENLIKSDGPDRALFQIKRILQWISWI